MCFSLSILLKKFNLKIINLNDTWKLIYSIDLFHSLIISIQKVWALNLPPNPTFLRN